jgi:hypothetical protein
VEVAAVSRNRYGAEKTVDTHTQIILAMYFLDRNNERPDWMINLKHTDTAW